MFKRTFIPYFLRLVVSHALLSTDARFFLFPAILVAQVLVGAMGNTPSIWGDAVGDISAVILFCWFLYICVWGPGRDFAPTRKDYTPFASSSRFVVAFPLQSSIFSRTRERRVDGSAYAG